MTDNRVIEIVTRALALPAEDREDYVRQQCDGDEDLRKRVLEAIRQSDPDRAEEKQELADLVSNAETFIAGNSQATDRIGPYKLLQVIGEGGMGTVYMAQQEHPVRRRVAVKVIKVGMDTKQVIARFEAERQALALMDHQNIARVLDAGTTTDSRPYFVMELVQGIPITEYCDRKPTDIAPATRSVRPHLPRDSTCTSEGDHSPRHQTVKHSRRVVRRAPGSEGHRLWSREGAPAKAD